MFMGTETHTGFEEADKLSEERGTPLTLRKCQCVRLRAWSGCCCFLPALHLKPQLFPGPFLHSLAPYHHLSFPLPSLTSLLLSCCCYHTNQNSAVCDCRHTKAYMGNKLRKTTKSKPTLGRMQPQILFCKAVQIS